MKQHYTDFYHGRINQRDEICASISVGLIFVLVIVAFLLIYRWENSTYTAISEETGIAANSQTACPEVIYNGVAYTPKEQVETYLFIGVDVDGPTSSLPGAYNGGQADALFLVVVDQENKSWQLLRLNRDSIVDVPVLDLKGNVIGYEQQQLALAHAYGDGLQTSCENVVRTVSALLEGQSIDGYVSLNMGGIAALNDAIGGVTVTVTSDFTAVDPTLVEGETITLSGQQAFEFVRTRWYVDDQTNLARMERQRIYLEALKLKVQTLSEEDMLRAYDVVSDYVVTNMASQDLLELAEKMKDYQEDPELTIEGINEQQGEFIAYILDKESLKQSILELFYQREEDL